MKTLYLVRGLPGSGKTTFANTLGNALNTPHVYAADDYFYNRGVYKFEGSRIEEAHEQCQQNVHRAMTNGDFESIIVHNTSTTEKELKPYLDMAEEYGYYVVSLVVENRHGSESIHGVPEKIVGNMSRRFSVKL